MAIIVSGATLFFFHTTSTHALAVSNTAPTTLTLEQGETQEFNLNDWFTGRDDPVYTIHTQNSLPFQNCVEPSIVGFSTLKIVAHSDNTKQECTIQVIITATNASGGGVQLDHIVSVRVNAAPPPEPLITFYHHTASNGRYDEEFQENEGRGFFTAFTIDETELPGILNNGLEINLELGGTAVLGTDYTIGHNPGSGTIIDITSNTFSICFFYDEAGGWVLPSTGASGGEIDINPNNIHDTDKTITLKITGVDSNCSGAGTTTDRFESETLTTTIVNTDSSTAPVEIPLALSETMFPRIIKLSGGESSTLYDLTQYFTGGTGDITYSFTPINSNCITHTIDQAAQTLSITALSPANNCTIVATITATDSATPPTTASITNIGVGAQIPVTFTASAPSPAKEDAISLTQGIAKELLDVPGWFQGARGNFERLSTTILEQDTNVPTCVTPSISGTTTLVLTPHNDNTQPTCTSQIRVVVTDDYGAGDDAEFRFWATVPAVDPPLATTSSIDAISLDKSASGSVTNIESFFTGGTGTVTYSAVSAALDCVTVSAITQSSGAHTLPITTTAAANACSSLITVTATDSTTPTPQTQTQTFTVYTPRLKVKSGASITNKNLTTGAGPTTITDVSQHFEGGIRPNIRYATAVTTTTTTPSSSVECVEVSDPDSSNNFTITPHSDISITSCAATITIEATGSDSDPALLNFGVAVTTPPPPPLTAATTNTATTSIFSDITLAKGVQKEFPDIGTYFTGGVGTITYKATTTTNALNPSDISSPCVTVFDQPKALNNYKLTIKSSQTNGLIGCSADVTVTARDTAGDAATQTFTVTIGTLLPANQLRASTKTLSGEEHYEGERIKYTNLSTYFTGGTTPYAFTFSTDDGSLCSETTATLEGTDTLVLTATPDNAEPCASTDITITVTDANSATFSRTFTLTVVENPGVVFYEEFKIPDQTLQLSDGNNQNVGFEEALLDEAFDEFAEEETLVFTAVSDDPSIATASISDAYEVLIDPKAVGTTTITITVTQTRFFGTNANKSGSYTFMVTIEGAVPLALSTTNTFTASILVAGADSSAIDLTQYFTGGTGNIVYTHTSTNENCITGVINPTTDTLVLTAKSVTNTCTSDITIKAKDGATPPKEVSTIAVSWGVPVLIAPTSTAPSAVKEEAISLTQGTAQDLDVSGWFQGGDGRFSYSAGIQAQDTTVPTCVSQSFSGTTLTLTPHNDNTQPTCTAQIRVAVIDNNGSGSQSLTYLFYVTVPTTTPLVTFENSDATNRRYDEEFQETEEWGWFTRIALDETSLPTIVGSSVFFGVDVEISGTAVLGTDYTLRHNNNAGSSGAATVTSSNFNVCFAYDESGGWVVSSSGGRDIYINPNDIHDTDKTITLKITGVFTGQCNSSGGTAFDRFEKETITTTIDNSDNSPTPQVQPLALSTTNTFTASTLVAGADSSAIDLTQYFTGGTGNIVYTHTSTNENCITGVINPTTDTLVLTAKSVTNTCTSDITIKAKDGATPPKEVSTIAVSWGVPVLIAPTSTAPSAVKEEAISLTQGTAQDLDVSGWFQGGDGRFSYSAGIQAQDTTVPTCVSQSFSGTTLTLTPHNDNTQPTCTAQIRVAVIDNNGSGSQSLTYLFYVTVPAIARPLTLSDTNTVSDITLQKGATKAFETDSYFTGGIGTVSYGYSVSDQSCTSSVFSAITNTLTLTAHNDNSKTEECTSNITITALDGGAPRSQSVRFTVTVPGIIQVGDNAPSFLSPLIYNEGETITLDVTNWVKGGDGRYKYEITKTSESVSSCVTVSFPNNLQPSLSIATIQNLAVTECNATLTFKATENNGAGDSVSIGLSIYVRDGTQTTIPSPLIASTTNTATTSVFSDITLAKAAQKEFPDIGKYFTGGKESITYTATAATTALNPSDLNSSCVTIFDQPDSLNNYKLTITASSTNELIGCRADVTVTADDGTSQAKQTFTVTIGTPPPLNELRASTKTLFGEQHYEGERRRYADISTYFTGGTTPYAFAFSTDDGSVCSETTATLENTDTLVLTATPTITGTREAPGPCASTDITITATDANSATFSRTFTLSVEPNAGVYSQEDLQIPDQTLRLSDGDNQGIGTIESFFDDAPDEFALEDTLTFTVSSDDPSIADVSLSSTDTILVDAKAAGTATITVEATQTRFIGANANKSSSYTFTVNIQENTRRSRGGGGGGGSSSGGGGSSSIRLRNSSNEETQTNTTQQVFTTQQQIIQPFTQTLSIEDEGEEVKTLQQFLNKNGFSVTQTGPGSSGQETTYFGTATQQALKTYQRSKNIPSTGVVDIETQTAITKDITIEILTIKILIISIQIVELQIQQIQGEAR